MSFFRFFPLWRLSFGKNRDVLAGCAKARFQAQGWKDNTSGRKTAAGTSGVLYVFFQVKRI
jgi:hypothetical protein